MAGPYCEKLALFSDENRGRGIRATATIEPETTLIVDKPYVTAVGEEFRQLHCSFCYQKGEKLKACGGCNFVYYCDNKCQSSNYPDHQYECKFLKSADCDVSNRTRTLLMVVQKHLKNVKKQSKKTITHDALGFPIIPDVLYQKRAASERIAKEEPISDKDMDHLWQYVRQKGLPITVDLVQLFQSILDANIFAIYDADQSTVIGEGLYTRLAMMNHGCRPNCVFTSVGRVMRIASIRPISPGEECVISYMTLMAPTRIRQKKLKSWYDFDCDCKRCTQDVEKDRLMYAIKCPQMNCLGSVLPWEPANLSRRYLACDKCGFDVQTTDLSEKVETTEAATEDLLEKAKNYNYHGHKLEAYGAILKQLDAVFKPHHIRIYRVVKKAFKVALRADEEGEALVYGERCLVALRAHLESCDRLLGYNLWRVGQLQAKLGLTREACGTLTEALPTLRVVYGADNALTVEAQGLIDRLSAGKDGAGILADIGQN